MLSLVYVSAARHDSNSVELRGVHKEDRFKWNTHTSILRIFCED